MNDNLEPRRAIENMYFKHEEKEDMIEELNSIYILQVQEAMLATKREIQHSHDMKK